MNLTDLTIRGLSLPEKGVVYYTDDRLTGFGIRVSEGGTKSYVLTHGPRRQRETIGRVGIIKLADARAEAKRRLAEYTLGKTNPQAVSWSKALAEYLEEVEKNCRPSTLKSYTRHLQSHFPFGETRLSHLTHQDFQRELKKLNDRPSELHHAFIYLRAFIKWAFRKHYFERNPIERMATPKPTKSKERTLSNDEIKAVWINAGDGIYGRIIKLLLLTGQRPGEVAAIQTTWLTNNILTIPPESTKNGRLHFFPIGKLSLPLLDGSQARGTVIFPARSSAPAPFKGWSKAKVSLDSRCQVKEWTIYDLRRTFRTKWAELGISREVAERYINHISGVHSGVAGVYDRYSYLPEMIAAVAKWEFHLTSIIETPLHSSRLGLTTKAREPRKELGKTFLSKKEKHGSYIRFGTPGSPDILACHKAASSGSRSKT